MSNNLDILIQTANRISKSSIIPSHLRNENELLAAMLFVQELDLPMISGLQNIAVINGKPTLNSHLLWALVMKQGDLKNVSVKSDNKEAIVKIVRSIGDFEASFNIEDAKRAGLVKQGSAWEKYPRQMLEARAKALCARLAYPEALFGVYSKEELEDAPSFNNDPKEVQSEVITEEPKVILDHTDQKRKEMLEVRKSLKEKKEQAYKLIEQLGYTKEEDKEGIFKTFKKTLNIGDTPTLEEADILIENLQQRVEVQENTAKSFTEDEDKTGFTQDIDDFGGY